MNYDFFHCLDFLWLKTHNTTGTGDSMPWVSKLSNHTHTCKTCGPKPWVQPIPTTCLRYLKFRKKQKKLQGLIMPCKAMALPPSVSLIIHMGIKDIEPWLFLNGTTLEYYLPTY